MRARECGGMTRQRVDPLVRDSPLRLILTALTAGPAFESERLGPVDPLLEAPGRYAYATPTLRLQARYRRAAPLRARAVRPNPNLQSLKGKHPHHPPALLLHPNPSIVLVFQQHTPVTGGLVAGLEASFLVRVGWARDTAARPASSLVSRAWRRRPVGGEAILDKAPPKVRW